MGRRTISATSSWRTPTASWRLLPDSPHWILKQLLERGLLGGEFKLHVDNACQVATRVFEVNELQGARSRFIEDTKQLITDQIIRLVHIS